MARARKKPDEQAPETPVETPESAAVEESGAEESGPPDDAAEEPAAGELAAEPAAAEPVQEAEAPAKPVRKRRSRVEEAPPAPAGATPRGEKGAKPKPAARKARAAAKPAGERKPIVRLPRAERPRGNLRERRGIVVSDGMEKTIVVRVDMVRPDRRYRKVVRRSRKLHAHDERNEAKVGDLVRIVETRPVSKTKSWRLAEVIESAK
jgi:small subunit ribosomal protein S17